MGLINDDRVVGIQIAIVGSLGQQNAIGHELDDAVFVQLLAKANLVTHHITQWRV